MGRRIPIESRIEAKIDKTDGCWFWNGILTHNGYGQFVYREGKEVKCMMAHRAVYQVYVGYIPDGMTLDHSCENRNCVNPEHLTPMTLGDNIRKSDRAVSEYCKRGHLYPPQTEFQKNKGQRRCYKCNVIRTKERKEVQNGIS